MESESLRLLQTDPLRPDKTAVAEAVSALGRGQLVIVPTETVYGLAADPRVPGAVERIFEAKGRSESKPIPLLGPDVEQIEKSGAELSPAARALARKFWPGPLTLILPADGREVAFRVPDHAVILAVLRRARALLAVTSANRSGEPPAANAQDAVAVLGSWVAVALDAGPSPGGVPSTVVKVVGDRIEILRAGAIRSEEIRGVVGGR